MATRRHILQKIKKGLCYDLHILNTDNLVEFQRASLKIVGIDPFCILLGNVYLKKSPPPSPMLMHCDGQFWQTSKSHISKNIWNFLIL